MSKRFKGDHSTVVVAVAPDKHSHNLVQAASSLCLRTGMKLRLVQVAEYWAGRSWPREITLEGPLAEAIIAVEDESLRAAQAHLRVIAESVPRGVSVETNAIAGFPAEGVIADAVANKAALKGKPSFCTKRTFNRSIIDGRLSCACHCFAGGIHCGFPKEGSWNIAC